MKAILIVAASALMLSGCLPPTKEGRPWYGESFHGTPEHRALEARYAGQRQAAAQRDAARLARERQQQAERARAGSSSDAAWGARQRARSECLRRVTESIRRQTYGQQSWRYRDNC
ncbi:MAG: hypothetical protein MEQ84_06665 [Mesorhizobium sp.]|nr:hypothetical protein [Mesorhizobium sp.]